MNHLVCKDCLPVFYTREELRDRTPDRPMFHTALDMGHVLILKHVELCPRHASAEAAMEATGLIVDEYDKEAKERRRYALLQAAAVLVMYEVDYEQHNIQASVDVAERLLAEIEKRETQS